MNQAEEMESYLSQALKIYPKIRRTSCRKRSKRTKLLIIIEQFNKIMMYLEIGNEKINRPLFREIERAVFCIENIFWVELFT